MHIRGDSLHLTWELIVQCCPQRAERVNSTHPAASQGCLHAFQHLEVLSWAAKFAFSMQLRTLPPNQALAWHATWHSRQGENGISVDLFSRAVLWLVPSHAAWGAAAAEGETDSLVPWSFRTCVTAGFFILYSGLFRSLSSRSASEKSLLTLLSLLYFFN